MRSISAPLAFDGDHRYCAPRDDVEVGGAVQRLWLLLDVSTGEGGVLRRRQELCLYGRGMRLSVLRLLQLRVTIAREQGKACDDPRGRTVQRSTFNTRDDSHRPIYIVRLRTCFHFILPVS